jgi:pSer/pThr/pTyr-binding forkhead associated (FHA) protein
MRLTVTRKDGQTLVYSFSEDPVHIGRVEGNQLVLPDPTVSKRHAAVYSTQEGGWMVEDFNSANKTYLNGQAVHKAAIRTGDCIKIADFALQVDLEDAPVQAPDSPEAEDTLHIDASLATPRSETVIRKPDAGHAPAMRMPAKRLVDFSQAADAISNTTTLEDLLVVLLNTTLRQFSAFHVWCALREQPSGPMTYHAGKRRDGKVVELGDIPLADKVNQAVDKGLSLVMPCVSADLEGKERIRSAMIVAIVNPSGCYGVIYVDNAMIHEHYSLSDLDYLMFLAVQTASILKRILKG